MLYDNALLIMAYCRIYQITKKTIYLNIAEKTAEYILREMTTPEGAFYSAQDADSEGVEGKYYVFEPSEIIGVLGEEIGEAFNQYFGITEHGNFEGKSIPNLLDNQNIGSKFDEYLQTVYEYRKNRYSLHLDDKVLTAWNALMIVAMCHLYRVSRNKRYLEEAIKAQKFIEDKLCEKDTLYVSYREGQRGAKGFLDEYANEIFALIALYEATFNEDYLEKAQNFCNKVLSDFHDEEQGGFFLYGNENEQLIIRPKESNNGVVPSGNSLMAYNFVRLYFLTDEKKFEKLANHQLEFVTKEAGRYPAGHTMFLMALSDYLDPPEKVTVVVKDKEVLEDLPCRIPLNTIVRALDRPTKGYSLKNDRTTFYVCRGHVCKPPTNDYTFGSN